jgi:hypothetical protein
VGCGSSDPSIPGAHQGMSCTHESDCAPGLVCGYAVADGCAARGTCIPRWPPDGGAACGALATNCGCDGQVVITGCNYFQGYAPAPVTTGLACLTDGGRDAFACGALGETCGPGGCCQPSLVCSPAGSTALPGSCVLP